MPLITVGANITLNSEGTTGAAIPAQAVYIGGSDGTNIQGIRVYNGNQGTTTGTVGLYTAALGLETNNVNGTGAFYRKEQQQNFTSTGVNANGAGTTRDASTSAYSNFSMQVVRTAGASAYVVDMEGSLDNANWVSIGTLSSSAASDMIHITNKPLRYYRYNVTTIGAGNTLSIYTLSSKY